MKRRGMCWAVALALLGASVVGAETAEEIANTAFRSTVLLTVEDQNGQPLRHGIGFLVADGLIASSLHVVEGTSAGYVNLAGEETGYALGNVAAKDRERDLVVIEIPATGLPTLPIGDSDALQAGDRVYVPGNLGSPDGAFSQGIVSRIRKVESGTFLQIVAPTSPVSSGGPVLNTAGEVIGITVSSVRDGQDLTFAIPANYLAKLLEGPLPAEPLSTSKDDAGAILSLGLMYYYGTGVPQSYAEAARWLQRAADQEQAEAQSMLGTMYYFGEGVPQNHLEASRLFRRAAEQGNSDARRWLGTLYYHGTGVPQSNAEAARWLRFAADQGDAEAQSKLAIMHYFGEGVPQNFLEASRLFRRAAEQGNADARRWLGTLYYDGTGVPQSYSEAARWYLLAARQGHVEAQWLLGRMYGSGVGVQQNHAQAARWYRLSAERGYDSAQWSLGVAHRYGYGVRRSFVAAHAWLNLAAAQSHDQATNERDDLAPQMSAAQIAGAQTLALHWWNRIHGDE